MRGGLAGRYLCAGSCTISLLAESSLATLLGFLAAALSTFSLVPQVVRTVRTRSAGDLAWGYLVTMLIAGVAWTGYGVLHRDVAVIVANAVAVSLASVIVATKVVATRHPAPAAPLAPPAPLDEFVDLTEEAAAL
jgi:MtN3 and saliva related transmembrane protein